MRTQNLKPTAIMDYDNPVIAEFVEGLYAISERDFLRVAYLEVMKRVYPIYDINELQPASTTLQKEVGSCTQRTALLEAMARSVGIPTRSQVYWIDGRFWHPRFPRWTYPFIPKRIMLLWTAFYIDNEWVDFSELIAPLENLADYATTGFTNEEETIFDAIAVRPVDLTNKLADCDCDSAFDLSHYVLEDGGIFDSRDDALAHYGSFQHTWRGIAFQLMFAGKTLDIADPKRVINQVYQAKSDSSYRLAG